MKKTIIWSLVLAVMPVFFGLDLNAQLVGPSGHPKIELQAIRDSIFVVHSTKEVSGTPYPANGLLVNTPKGFVLIDTPWDDEQAKELLKMVSERFNKKIILAYITHAHEDRMGGIRTLIADSIPVFSNFMTVEKAIQQGYPAPRAIYDIDTILNEDNIFF